VQACAFATPVWLLGGRLSTPGPSLTQKDALALASNNRRHVCKARSSNASHIPSHVRADLARAATRAHAARYRGISAIRTRTSLGPYRRPMSRVLMGVLGGWTFSCGRGTPLVTSYPWSRSDGALKAALPGVRPVVDRPLARQLLVNHGPPYNPRPTVGTPLAP
jgi:hypothetical protein